MDESEVQTRLSEVRARLAEVCDPELDEAVTDLGFIDGILVRANGEVEVKFHLPTFWCAANFAFLMASDMRNAILQLPWVTHAHIELVDHFCSDEISSGLDGQRDFQQIFPDEADANLEDLRVQFQRKSFQRRQELLLRALLEVGQKAEQLVSLSLEELGHLSLSSDVAKLRERYLSARTTLGFPETHYLHAFHTVEGEPLDLARLDAYLLQLRRVRINTEFNGVLCRGLLEARYGTKQPDGLVAIQAAQVSQLPARTYDAQDSPTEEI